MCIQAQNTGQARNEPPAFLAFQENMFIDNHLHESTRAASSCGPGKSRGRSGSPAVSRHRRNKNRMGDRAGEKRRNGRYPLTYCEYKLFDEMLSVARSLLFSTSDADSTHAMKEHGVYLPPGSFVRPTTWVFLLRSGRVRTGRGRSPSLEVVHPAFIRTRQGSANIQMIAKIGRNEDFTIGRRVSPDNFHQMETRPVTPPSRLAGHHGRTSFLSPKAPGS